MEADRGQGVTAEAPDRGQVVRAEEDSGSYWLDPAVADCSDVTKAYNGLQRIGHTPAP